MRSRISAGILLFRMGERGLEVLLGHPGGPYFTSKGDGHWTVPKGEVEGDEDFMAVALREFAEETGTALSIDPSQLVSLGEIIQKGGKRVVAWAVEGDLDPVDARSNLFTMEWPPGSGRLGDYPEIDEVAWLTPGEARRRIKASQIPLVDRLEAALEARLSSPRPA